MSVKWLRLFFSDSLANFTEILLSFPHKCDFYLKEEKFKWNKIRLSQQFLIFINSLRYFALTRHPDLQWYNFVQIIFCKKLYKWKIFHSLREIVSVLHVFYHFCMFLHVFVSFLHEVVTKVENFRLHAIICFTDREFYQNYKN